MSMRRTPLYLFLLAFLLVMGWVLAGSRLATDDAPAQENLVPGRNVNMVSGTTLPGGDPWLQRQNEPSLAVSTRNPLHLLAGANDYRTVDIPFSEGGLPGKAQGAMAGDAWLGVYKSYDGGESWVSSLVPGFPQDQSPVGLASPLKAFSTAADPIVRAGTNGLFYYSGMAFNRAQEKGGGSLFVSRFIDNNNIDDLRTGDPIKYLDTRFIDVGTTGQFIDMPRIAVDIPRGTGTVTVDGQILPRSNVYAAYTVFLGNTDINVRSRIVFRRSTDCGATWGPALKISESQHIIQGAAFAIDPKTGTIYLAFRRFQHPSQTDSIVIARSTDYGQTFSSPALVANIDPFDQPATDALGDGVSDPIGPSFRTNSYPTIAVDAAGIVYVAWAERGRGPVCEARVVLSSAAGGVGWSMPQAVADPGQTGIPGHQYMPSLTFAQGKLVLIWYDQRNDEFAPLFGIGPWLGDDPSINIRPVRHTTDVRSAEADPGNPPVFRPSVQVSKYLWTLKSGSDTEIEQAQVNPPNYELFKGGTTPFHGDYIEVAAAPPFVLKNGAWTYNTDPSKSPVFHAVWTDNRDVRPPTNGNWAAYTPPASDQGVFGNIACGALDPANMGMRNQNIYTSTLVHGLVAAAPGGAKTLGKLGEYLGGENGLIPRTFAVYVKNPTSAVRAFRLTIDPEPAGVDASFAEFEDLETLDVMIAPFSTIARTVFVKSGLANAGVSLSVAEIDALGGVPVTNGLATSVLLNPDPSSPARSEAEVHNPNIRNPNIRNWDEVNRNLANPNIRNPNIRNWDEINPSVVNPNIRNSDYENPNIRNEDIVNPNIRNYDISNPNIRNLDIVNPNIRNTSIGDGYSAAAFDAAEISDVQFTLKNDGNTTSTYTLKLYSKEALPEDVYAQLLLYRVHYTPSADYYQQTSSPCALKQEPQHELVLNVSNPNIRNPNIANPNIRNPNIRNGGLDNASVAVGPGEEIEAVLRLVDFRPKAQSTARIMSTGEAFNVESFAESIGFAATAQAVNTVDAQTRPVDELAPAATATKLIISTSALPYGVRDTFYSAQLMADGGTRPYTWSLNSGQLPPGLSLGASGTIAGTIDPAATGLYQFIVRVDDQTDAFDTQAFAIYVDTDAVPDSLSILTATLPNGVLDYWYGATLQAAGGDWPLAWSLDSGTLPPGLSLDDSGVISGKVQLAEGQDPPTTFNFVVRVTDRDSAHSVTRPLSITVNLNTGSTFIISGRVYDENNQPLAGAVMRGLPNTPQTDGTGYYQDTVPEFWAGTVTPFMGNTVFDPPSRSYSSVTGPLVGQSFNAPMQVPTTTISGRVMYNGLPLSQYTSQPAFIWVRDEIHNTALQTTPTYDPADGTYTIPNVPSGRYGIEVRVDAAEPRDGRFLPGDFYGWESPITVGAPNPVTADLACRKILHLTAPVDNFTLLPVELPPPYDPYISSVTFQWEAIAEAARYEILIDRWRDGYGTSLGDMLHETGITATQYTPSSLPVSGAGEYYRLCLFAYNANNVLVGQLMCVYKNAYGWDYRFRVVAPPTVSTLLTNLEYPSGLSFRQGLLYIVESNWRHGFVGKNQVDAYNVASGQLTTLLSNPVCSWAAAAGTNGDPYVYLTSFQGDVPGDVGKVSRFLPPAGSEEPLVDIAIASRDIFIDGEGDIFIAGSSYTQGAKSLYRLPAGNYASPQVLQTGYGRVECVSKRGGDIYFSDAGSVKRFNIGTPGTVEIFANKDVTSMALSAAHLYYVEYTNGILGRINLATKTDEILATGLVAPHCIRIDPTSLNVYFTEAGTSNNEYKDGKLKVIGLN